MVRDLHANPLYGIYRGRVVGTDENERYAAGRLKVLIPDLQGSNVTFDDLPWALPLFPIGGSAKVQDTTEGAKEGDTRKVDYGMISIPKLDSNVAVFFEGGDINAPVWLGSWFERAVPSKAVYQYGRDYPKIHCWSIPGEMRIRMVEHEVFEIDLGESGEDVAYNEGDPNADPPVEGAWEEKEHKEYETYIRMDLRRKRMTIRSKYQMDIVCGEKLSIRAPDIQLSAAVETEYDEEGNVVSKTGGTLRLSAYDAEAQEGTSIRMTTTSVRCGAKHTSGFHDH